MTIEAKKLQVIQHVIQSNNVTALEQVLQLLQADAIPVLNERDNIPNVTKAASTISSNLDLDALIQKNMPNPGKSLSIEEIRALAKNTEKALEEGSDNTDAIFRAITDNDLK